MEKYTNRELGILLKEIQNDLEEIKKDGKTTQKRIETVNMHTIRHSQTIVYLQGIVKKIWDENETKGQKQLDDNKEKINKLTKLLVTILIAICSVAIGINNIPEAIQKLLNII